MEFYSKSPADTENFAENFAKKILTDQKMPHIFLFFGDLGAGKTTFLRGFARGLGISERISSPTFSLFYLFEMPKNPRFEKFAHFDLYRADENSALGFLEISEILADKKIISAVEWAEKLPKKIFQKGDFAEIFLENLSEKSRKIKILF